MPFRPELAAGVVMVGGETEQEVSGWTTDTLRELMQSKFAAARDHTDSRFTSNRDYIDGKIETLVQRFEDVDKATELLSATVTAVPTDLQKVAGDLLRLMDERDRRIEERFTANTRLSQTESTLNQTALAAALAAQEKAAAVQVDTFSSLIRGLGERIDRTIDKNAELANVAASALGARVDQLSEQSNRTESRIAEILAGKAAVVEQRTDTRGGAGFIFGAVGAVIGVIGFLVVIFQLVAK